MFDISQKLEDKLVLNGVEYQLFLSFDNVLKLFTMWRDESIPVEIKPSLALSMLTKEDVFRDIDPMKALGIYSEIFDRYINITKSADEEVRYDIEGNIMPNKPKKGEKKADKPLYSLKYDGEYIFASFMQAYKIDLIEAQGKLHWKKFNALLAGLPEGTKLIEIMKIRAWKPSKGESSKEKQRMRDLQEEYALPNE